MSLARSVVFAVLLGMWAISCSAAANRSGGGSEVLTGGGNEVPRAEAGIPPLSEMHEAGSISTLDATALVGDSGSAEESSHGETSVPLNTWTPASLPALAFWLDAAQEVTADGGKVSTWTDIGPNHHQAIQQRSGMQPTLVEAAFNGRPVIRFKRQPATSLSIADAPSLQWGTSDFAVAVVFGHTNQPVAGSHLGGWGMFLNKITQPSGGRVGWGIMANWPTTETTAVNSVIGCETKEASGVRSTMTGYNDGKMRLWAMRRTTAQRALELRRNGIVDSVDKTGTYVNDINNKGTPVTLGGMRSNPTADPGFGFDGDIAEVVAVGGTVSDDDMSMLEHYLTAKYALGN